MAADSLVHQVETDYFLAGDLSDDQIKEVSTAQTCYLLLTEPSLVVPLCKKIS